MYFQENHVTLLKREFGKVIMPAWVIYSRYPKIGLLAKKLYDVGESMKLIKESEKFLIQNLIATLNGCSFCIDISKRKSIDKNIGLEKFNDLMNYQKSEYILIEKNLFLITFMK